MKIAVLGAGYTGLACAWHLLHSPFRPRGLSVTIFDKKGIGAGASGIAAGLLHSYVGLHAKRNWKGREGMEATERLLNEASIALGSPVSSKKGILRIAQTPEQEKNYLLCAKENSDDVSWWVKEKCKEQVPSLATMNGVFIKSGQIVYSRDYLQGLWRSCRLQNAELSLMPIQKLAQLRHFDRIIVAAGSETNEIEELADIKVTLVKGQLLELAWPEGIPPLPYPVVSQAYVVMNPDGKSCIVGSTYERDFETRDPDIHVAKVEILPKLGFIPHLQFTEVLGCRAHIRVSTQDHFPISKQLTPRIWTLTGMGSKGLLYHALFAEELANKVLRA